MYYAKALYGLAFGTLCFCAYTTVKYNDVLGEIVSLQYNNIVSSHRMRLRSINASYIRIVKYSNIHYKAYFNRDIFEIR